MPNHDLARWQDEADERLTPEPKPDGIYLRVNYEYHPAGDGIEAWNKLCADLPARRLRMDANADVRLLWLQHGVVVREKVA